MYATLRLFIPPALLMLLLAACGAPQANQDVNQDVVNQDVVPILAATPQASPSAPDAGAEPNVEAPTEQSGDSVAVDAQILVPTPTPANPTSAAPTIDPATLTFALDEIATGLTEPLFVTHAGDGSGRLFILEQPGTIRIIADGVLLEQPFLDIREQVTDAGNEQGLLGLTFAPDYADSGIFYLNYTGTDGDTRIARFRVAAADPDAADPDSEEIILTIEQPARNHNGGTLHFGLDGMLYIGMGDGGGANDTYGNAQNPATLLGKLLRIDVSDPDASPYAIPADNPWVTNDWDGVDVRDEIIAVGLRNPWRFSFDRATGDLWIGDVGQNQYEEINRVPPPVARPHNFGWPIMEGLHCFRSDGCEQAGLVLPVVEYEHQGHCSVTGGYVYRGAAFPAMQGIYFYGDYCSGTIWALTPDESGAWQSTEVLDTDFSLSSFGEDEQGELYVTDLAGGTVARLGLDE